MASVFFLTTIVACAESAPEKYSLWNPTPREKMREMSPDRPDTTESPFTVDAGHYQLELSFLSYTKNGDNSEGYSWMPMNLKAGIYDDLDLQVIMVPYSEEHRRGEDTARGFGNLRIRAKQTILNQSPRGISLALMPFFDLPTGNNEFDSVYVEGGLIVPADLPLTERTTLGVMAEFDVETDRESLQHTTKFVHSAVVGTEIVDDIGGYLEYVGVFPDREGYEAVIGTGLTYGFSKDIQFDIGINFGLSESADDFNVFIGVSIRS